MRTTISTRGRFVLPATIRKQDAIQAGDEFDVQRVAEKDYRLVRKARPRNHRVVEWLLACPEKGYFVPVTSKSTDKR
jgi:AbrB family looped-hinge helix DNA binding protein